MIKGIQFSINNQLYLRDPQETQLGQKILSHSIEMLSTIGIENFTFKKLAQEIESTEASLYRYFSSKHQLLLYLISWYWEWVDYLIHINTRNITDPKQRLQIIIKAIINATSENALTEYINENLLHRIVVHEGSKSYHTAAVDKENEAGIYINYKNLVEKVSQAILAFNPDFPYPHSLASNLFEMANNQQFFAEHLPRLTDIESTQGTQNSLEKMMNYFTFKLIE